MVIHADKRHDSYTDHQRRYNAAEISEVTAIIPGVEDSLIGNFRYIILQGRGVRNSATNILYSETNAVHRSYDALVYPFLFPYKED